MSTLEATQSMIELLPENDLELIQQFVRRMLAGNDQAIPSASKDMTRERFLNELAIAREQSDHGETVSAMEGLKRIRDKYGLYR